MHNTKETEKTSIVDFVKAKPGQLLDCYRIARGTRIPFERAANLLIELAGVGRLQVIELPAGNYYRLPMATRLRAIDRRV